MSINKYNGVLTEEVHISELIGYLKEHMDMYGDNPVSFMLSGDDEAKVQFDHYEDALVIDIYENFD